MRVEEGDEEREEEEERDVKGEEWRGSFDREGRRRKRGGKEIS